MKKLVVFTLFTSIISFFPFKSFADHYYLVPDIIGPSTINMTAYDSIDVPYTVDGQECFGNMYPNWQEYHAQHSASFDGLTFNGSLFGELNSTGIYHYSIGCEVVAPDHRLNVTKDVTVNVFNQRDILRMSFPNGTVHSTYPVIHLEANHPVKGLKFFIADGNIPSGLHLSSDGTLDGTPTKVGTYHFNMGVTYPEPGNDGTVNAFRSYTIIISNPSQSSSNSQQATSNIQASPFSDVSMYNSQIDYLYNQGIIQGYEDGSFLPTAPIKRIQAVQMILKQLGITDFTAPLVHFTDLMPGDYGYDQVAKAVQLGFIKGKQDGRFDPWGYLTRGQMAVMMDKAFQLTGKTTSNFGDVPKSFWAKSAIDTLASNGITSGYKDHSFRPNQDIQRNHFSVFLVNYLENCKGVTESDLLKNVISLDKKSVVTIIGKDGAGHPFEQGSGFFVGKGLILTNLHVARGASYYDIVMDDGETYQADGIVKSDDDHDLAYLKISAPLNIPPLKLASYTTAQKGDPIIAVGSPEGLQNTVSEGITSGIRTISGSDSSRFYADVLQIDAPITQGSSGGPLIDSNGEVIGVNTFGLDNGGNLNFAVGITADELSTVKNLSKTPLDQLPVLYTQNLGNGQTYHYGTIYPNAVKETILREFSQPVTHIVTDPNAPIIYGIDSDKDIFQLNYVTNQLEKLSFKLSPDCLYLRGSTLYAGLQTQEHSDNWETKDQTGAIAIIDTKDFSLKNQFNIQLDPYDLVADNTHIYVTSGSGQFSDLNSYDSSTGKLVSSITGIEDKGYLGIDPSFTHIYTIDPTVPTSIYWPVSIYPLTDGSFTGKSYNPPSKWDENDLESKFAISPDGHYLIDSDGTTFDLTNNKEMNLSYHQFDSGERIYNFSSIYFDLSANRIYTYNPTGRSLSIHNEQTFQSEQKIGYVLKNDVQHLMTYNGQLYAVVKVSGPKVSYAVESLTFNQ